MSKHFRTCVKWDCEAIRAQIALKLGKLLSYMIRNAFIIKNQHMWEQIPIEGGLNCRSHNIPFISRALARGSYQTSMTSLMHKTGYKVVDSLQGLYIWYQVRFWYQTRHKIILFISVKFEARYVEFRRYVRYSHKHTFIIELIRLRMFLHPHLTMIFIFVMSLPVSPPHKGILILILTVQQYFVLALMEFKYVSPNSITISMISYSYGTIEKSICVCL